MSTKIITVLYCEDNGMTRRAIRRLLHLAGISVVEANDAAGALAVLDAGAQIDVILTDVILPDIDGMRLRQLISARWPHIPVIAFTGMCSEDVQAGVFDAIFEKPTNPEILIKTIRHLAGRGDDEPKRHD